MGQSDRRSARLLDLTAQIVSSYVRNQHLPRDTVAATIRDVHETLTDLSAPSTPVDADQKLAQKPTASANNSVHDDFIVCLEDGKQFKSLKRHLMTSYGLTPDQYRAKWGLGADYPMVAPSYSKRRSSISKGIGLGGRLRANPSYS
ncbi:MucR family transcriptional regulator [Aquibium sp. ELW1220]|uniref:MucR family transcriptional regulator n=1 Tax=Aquibium sp. ELW1220 TaxID=2976766 RepID=UPI0025B141E4|nr:MucR family transcriptional regulator [Aquibium sp. ELW1220]MDN2584317.1 MucR family transcriptional regulator [Aquibium sp. ELW1220]